MKVKDLFEAIKLGKKEYGKDFMNWDVGVESHLQSPLNCTNCSDNLKKDDEGFLYIKIHGFNTYMPKNKFFTINIHY